jgi:hypothetical protein
MYIQYVHILAQFMISYFSLQVKNKPHDKVAIHAFILEPNIQIHIACLGESLE